MTTTPSPITTQQAMPQRMRFTRQHVNLLLDAGLLAPGSAELINGDILLKMPQKPPHVFVCNEVGHSLDVIFGRAFVRRAAPVVLSESDEPEPDICVTQETDRVYLQRNENPPIHEVRLLVEVSDSTLSSDKTTKLAMYAQARVPEYWIVSIPTRELIVHREPVGEQYASIQVLSEHDSVAPLAAPTARLSVADILP